MAGRQSGGGRIIIIIIIIIIIRNRTITKGFRSHMARNPKYSCQAAMNGFRGIHERAYLWQAQITVIEKALVLKITCYAIYAYLMRSCDQTFSESSLPQDSLCSLGCTTPNLKTP